MSSTYQMLNWRTWKVKIEVSWDDWQHSLIEVCQFFSAKTAKVGLCQANKNIQQKSWSLYYLCHPLRTNHRHDDSLSQGRTCWRESWSRCNPCSNVTLHQQYNLPAHQANNHLRLLVSHWLWRRVYLSEIPSRDPSVYPSKNSSIK